MRLPLRLLRCLAAAGVALSAAPSPSGPATLWKDAPEKVLLASGLPLVYQRDRSSPTSVIALVSPGGRVAVPPGLDGLAYLTARLTLEIPDQDKVQELMAQASRMRLVCLEDCSLVLVECLSESLEPALRVASKIIQNPLISGLRIGYIKEMMALNGKAEEDDAVAAGHNAAFRALFGGNGYGSAGFGTAASLKAIERKDIVSYYKRHFTRKSLFFCAVTDLERETIRGLLEKNFRDFPAGEMPGLPAQMPALPVDREVALTKDTRQAYIGRAFILPPPTVAGHAKGILLETLLGKGPGSRLWGLRLHERLAYNVGAELTWTKSSGIFEAYLETDKSKALQAGQSLDRVLAELRASGIDEEELRTTKTMAKAQFLRSAEAKMARVRLLGDLEILGLGFGHLTGFSEALDAVTLDEMNAYLRQALEPGRALKVAVGPPAGS